MSDMRDVVAASHDAASARSNLQVYAGQVEERASGNVALAILFTGDAICAQLAALTTRLDYLSHAARRA